jgi:hypothetical protein
MGATQHGEGLVAPCRSRVTGEFGMPCDPHRDQHFGSRHAIHDGCAGWWPLYGDDAFDGWVCACRCHADGARWPAAPDDLRCE